MKAIICARCGDIRGLRREWVYCSCGRVGAKWKDPTAGTAIVRTDEPLFAYILGLNNSLLVPALQGKTAMWQDFREFHEQATEAPSYVFDKSRAGCWAVPIRAGFSDDVEVEPLTREEPS